MNDEIRLTMPHDPALHGVAHLVVGGLGVRLKLTIEHLEDLQLALDAVLQEACESENVTITVRLRDRGIETTIGPLREGVRQELEATGDGVGLRRILDTVVDRFELGPGEGGDWLTLTKALDGKTE